MTARLRLFIALLLLAIAPALAPAAGAAAHVDGRHCASCADASCPAPEDLGCAAGCLAHGAVHAMVAPDQHWAAPAGVTTGALPHMDKACAAASWPPPTRPPRS